MKGQGSLFERSRTKQVRDGALVEYDNNPDTLRLIDKHHHLHTMGVPEEAVEREDSEGYALSWNLDGHHYYVIGYFSRTPTRR